MLCISIVFNVIKNTAHYKYDKQSQLLKPRAKTTDNNLVESASCW